MRFTSIPLVVFAGALVVSSGIHIDHQIPKRRYCMPRVGFV